MLEPLDVDWNEMGELGLESVASCVLVLVLIQESIFEVPQ